MSTGVVDIPEVMRTWPYQDERAIIAAYVPAHFPEDFLANVYMKAKAQGIMAQAFAGFENLTLNRFISWIHEKPIIVGYDKETYNIAGIGFLYDIMGKEGCRKASLGYLFFKEYWATQTVRSLARLALQFWFVDLKVDLLEGMQVITNGLARNFSRKWGFELVGRIPQRYVRDGEFVDATLVMLSKEAFLAREAERADQPNSSH